MPKAVVRLGGEVVVCDESQPHLGQQMPEMTGVIMVADRKGRAGTKAITIHFLCPSSQIFLPPQRICNLPKQHHQ